MSSTSSIYKPINIVYNLIIIRIIKFCPYSNVVSEFKNGFLYWSNSNEWQIFWNSFKNNIWDVFDCKISLKSWGKCPFYATCGFNFSNDSNNLRCDECCSLHRFRYKMIRQIDNEIRKNFIEMDNILKKRNEKNKFRFY